MPEKLLLDMRHLRTELTQGKKGSIVAVNNVTFQTEKGEILGLVGESGCRKPVTALSIMNLLRDTSGKITDGEVYLEGNNLLRCSEEEIQRIRGENVSMVFQEAMPSLNPAMRVNTQLMEAILLYTDKTECEAEEHTLKMLEQVGIPDPTHVGRSCPHQLSGSISQRMTTVMIMSCDPYLLATDRPTATLDVTIWARTLDLMRRIRREIHTGILLIMHDLGVVTGMCSRVIAMYAGRIVEEAPVQHLFYEPMHPYIKGLIASVSRLGSGVTSLPSTPGSMPDLSMMPPGCKFAPRCRYTQDHCHKGEPPLVELSGGRKYRYVLAQGKETTME